jgi:hypothetical protein
MRRPTLAAAALGAVAWLAGPAGLGAGLAGPAAGASGRPVGTLTARLAHWMLPVPVYRTVAVADGSAIYVLGGHDTAGGTVSTVLGFNPASGRTSVAGSLAVPTHGAAAALVGGRVLVFGGASSQVHDTVQAFDPASRQARVIGYLPVVLADTTAATVGRTTVLIGGFNGYGPQSQVWATTNGTVFRAVARLALAVRYPAVAVSGHDVYVFGGLLSGGEYDGVFTTAVQQVDLRAGSARVVGHLPMPLAHAMGAAMSGGLYVMGGSTGRWTSAQILRFDPAGDTVRLAGKLPEPLTDAAVATSGRTTYLLGGISAHGPLRSITVVRAPK